ncbi:hydantoinase B/oxoprolinase family protein [Sporolactobacillus sp. THM7-4]|nr:hydantoinase B/oxoprolinase family protein [Sporolactobacillus sp. THM7-4]
MEDMAQSHVLNSVKVKIIWDRLISVLEEQAKTLIRTSFTSILSDSEDLSAGLFNSKGEMIAQANTGTPGHINSMAIGVKHFLEHNPPETLRPGDVLLGNNPYEISGHLLDLTVVTPAFIYGKLVGYFASTCHCADIGGIGYSPNGESIFEEGLQIPYLKFYSKGVLNDVLKKIIVSNVRAPKEVMGDLHAQVLANEVAIKSLKKTMDEFGLEEIDAIGHEIMHRSEMAMREAIKNLPDGVYFNEMETDGFEQPIKLKCRLTISGDELEVDFTGSSPASMKGINVSLPYLTAYSTYIIKATIAPEVPNNHGSFRPVHIKAEKGSCVHAVPPMPTTGRHVLGQFAPECVMGAIHQVAPKTTIAEGATSIWSIPVSGDDFAYVAFSSGGMGARPNKDGLSATSFPSSVHGVSVEIMETNSPLIIQRKELRGDSGGAGQFRGGLGQVIQFTVESRNNWNLSSIFDRFKNGARGLDGGLTGACGAVYINGVKSTNSKAVYHLKAGDQVELYLPGGGGYGNPLDRPKEKVLSDLRNNYISKETAKKVYKLQQ